MNNQSLVVHHVHHRRQRTVQVPVVRTEYVPRSCNRPHRGGGTTLLAGLGIITLLAICAGSSRR